MALQRMQPFNAPDDPDPAVDAALGKTVYDRVAKLKQLTPTQRRKAERDAARTTATFDLPPTLLENLRRVAKDEGVPVSGLAALLLQVGLQEMNAGRFELRRYKRLTRSIRFEFDLETDLSAEE
jgi:hypothetical protein